MKPSVINTICPVCGGGMEDIPAPGDSPEIVFRPVGWDYENNAEWVHVGCSVPVDIERGKIGRDV